MQSQITNDKALTCTCSPQWIKGINVFVWHLQMTPAQAIRSLHAIHLPDRVRIFSKYTVYMSVLIHCIDLATDYTYTIYEKYNTTLKKI